MRIALRLRDKTSAWASWLPYWPTCHATLLQNLARRFDWIRFDSRFRVFSYLYQNLMRADGFS
jgi:hypothetical protein